LRPHLLSGRQHFSGTAMQLIRVFALLLVLPAVNMTSANRKRIKHANSLD
jgi:hypothetical protein